MFLIYLKFIFHCKLQRTPELNLAEKMVHLKQSCSLKTLRLTCKIMRNKHFKTKICYLVYIYSIGQKKRCLSECHMAQGSAELTR